jgi:hypothetical protein
MLVFCVVTPCELGTNVSEEHTASTFRAVCNDIFISPPLESTATHTTGAGDDGNERSINSLEMKTLNDNFQPLGSNMRQHRLVLGHF